MIVMFVSINRHVKFDAPTTVKPELPTWSNRKLLLLRFVDAKILKLKNVPLAPFKDVGKSPVPKSPIREVPPFVEP
jgi:hypothetical protein